MGQEAGDSAEVSILYLSVRLYRVGRVTPSNRDAWDMLNEVQ